MPPPRSAPVVVVPGITTMKGQALFGIVLMGRFAQSALNFAFAMGMKSIPRRRVAVTPKLPAVPVVAESVTVLTARMNLSVVVAEIEPFKDYINNTHRVAARLTPVRLPVVPSLYVTATVAVVTVAPVSVYHSSHH